MKRIDYQETVNATSPVASETIDILATEKSDGNITGCTVEYRDSEEKLSLHIWHDFPDGEDPDTHYDTLNTVLSNLPISAALSAESSPIRFHDEQI
jgi:hypothetical protein